jgi:glycosyltransferase involved in cell wall biosynthesis
MDTLVPVKAIHQFHAGCRYGDGITNGMLFVQKILRESGYRSDIYCFDIDPRLAHHIHPANSYSSAADEVLLLHYSLGTQYDAWISAIRTPSILVYHNITPATFFPPDSELHRLVNSGRRQLAEWARQGRFVGAIADSTFNGDELAGWGYPSIASIGLLVDLDRLREHFWTRDLVHVDPQCQTLLFVGRLCEHKGQLDLVRMMHLLRSGDRPVRLLLAGDTTSPSYEASVREEIAALGLEDCVRLLGKRPDEDIYALYRGADLYVSLSEHEGFGMPLVEAMAFDLPVLASDAGSVAATLGCGGIILKDRKSEHIAAAARLLLDEPLLRREVIDAQRRSLERFERPTLVGEFEAYLHRLGFAVSLSGLSRSAPSDREVWTLEGPFDSSYSLALVNRELARNLNRLRGNVALLSRDGPGPFPPDMEFLKRDKEIASISDRANRHMPPDVVLRNQYPPQAGQMRGRVRIMANYAWEESGFPAPWVEEFNRTLALITATSTFVKKVLRDNGVRTPIEVVGNGADHIAWAAKRALPKSDVATFRFVHISSCFPRKGADVLLAAWAAAFTAADRVELVIKTFPNPHHRMDEQIRQFKATNPASAPISLINGDLDDEALCNLLAGADAVICPSRGEGFGLPLAEAMWLGKPVITTAFGGQTDFCTPETAWLCDYAFAPAQSHLEVPGSVWVEPDIASLVEALRGCYADANARTTKAQAGQALIRERYTWDAVARRTQNAIDRVQSRPPALRLPRVGWVTSWNTRCGIAAYAQALACAFDPGHLMVFASRTADLIDPRDEGVVRCWSQGSEDDLDELFDAICEREIDAIVLQFNFGFFNLFALARLIDRLAEKGIILCIILHSTMDVKRPDLTIRLADAIGALSKVGRLLVHSVDDLNRLKAIGLTENVALLPMGLPPPAPPRSAPRQARELVIATFGYLLPHKGLREVINAFALVRKKIPRARLKMLNALYPVPESEMELVRCRDEINRLSLAGSVTLISDFLPEERAIAELRDADLVVFPYQHTQESASAAVKLGLSSLTPIACTPLPIFSDIASVVHFLPGCEPAEMAQGIVQILKDDRHRARTSSLQAKWVDQHQWPLISRRLEGLIRGLLCDANPVIPPGG